MTSAPTRITRRTEPLPFRAGSLLSDIPALTAFEQDVEDALDGDELRFSERERLLKRAQHFGIRPFDAKVLIAMVQSRVQDERRRMPEPSNGTSPVASIAAFAITQSLILLGAWWTFIR